MRAVAVAAVGAALLGHATLGENIKLRDAFPEANRYMRANEIASDAQDGFRSLFNVTALVRSLTSPSPEVFQTTTTPKAGLEEHERHDKCVQSQNNAGAGSHNLMTAALRPILAAFNVLAVAQRQMRSYLVEEIQSPIVKQSADVQIQILSRTPAINQQLEPPRLLIALTLSVMTAMYGWKMGSYSGLKCCTLLLFLVYFRLRCMHNTRS
ncbi:hypothetical protein NQ176_g7646 [Zarea fungicola]|uniref:Uncharacterized protein n=1 Tax=Zarea fungicola TaxID=93591 RepID=A0ACC1MY39_9HYPO|nr:hypothetical protein NQ176_g7646 [Lecanicillium fungicola]